LEEIRLKADATGDFELSAERVERKGREGR